MHESAETIGLDTESPRCAVSVSFVLILVQQVTSTVVYTSMGVGLLAVHVTTKFVMQVGSCGL